MEQFRIYLRAELGKLRHQGDADKFVAAVSSDLLLKCGLPTNVADISTAFGSQEAVDHFVKRLVEPDLRELVRCCDENWRKNNVFKTLARHTSWQEAMVPIQNIDLQQAEGKLANIWERNQFNLISIANDSELWQNPPYYRWVLSAPVRFSTCLARAGRGRWRIFDGVHRAILLTKQGRLSIPVYFCEDSGN